MVTFWQERDALVAQTQETLLSRLEHHDQEIVIAYVEAKKHTIISSLPHETEVASTKPLDPQVDGTCNNPQITCNVTYSVAETTDTDWSGYTSGSATLPNSTIEDNPILGGFETMNNYSGKVSHIRYTSITFDGKKNKANGRGVCGNCYLYASQTLYQAIEGDKPFTWEDEAGIDCEPSRQPEHG
jgi:hypothetical protein